MIPKVIHYCWLSDEPFPKEIQECMNSWREVLPDFEIKRWSTKNFDIDKIPYVRQAYEEKKWAFASDYIRLYALYTEGGIYLDVDVYVIKRFDEYLNNGFFSAIECYPGLNDDMQIQAAVMGAEKRHQFLADCMEYYHKSNFINEDGTYNELISPVLYAKVAEKYGFEYTNKRQILRDNITLYTIDEIAPLTDYVNKHTKLVHCCAGSWRWEKLTGIALVNYKIKNFIVKILVSVGLKKTWNWKKKFKDFKSSI